MDVIDTVVSGGGRKFQVVERGRYLCRIDNARAVQHKTSQNWQVILDVAARTDEETKEKVPVRFYITFLRPDGSKVAIGANTLGAIGEALGMPRDAVVLAKMLRQFVVLTLDVEDDGVHRPKNTILYVEQPTWVNGAPFPGPVSEEAAAMLAPAPEGDGLVDPVTGEPIDPDEDMPF